MRLLLVCPMPPDRGAPGAIPALLHALVEGLRGEHELTLACVVDPGPREQAAVERLRAGGLDVRVAERGEPRGLDRWRRRVRFVHGWLVLRRPWRTVWYAEPALQGVIDAALADTAFDVAVAVDESVAIYDLGATLPRVVVVHELRRSPPTVSAQRRGLQRAVLTRLARADARRWPAYHRRVVAGYDVVEVFTEDDAAELVRIAPQVAGRVRVNPFGITLPPAADPALAIPDTLLFAGDYSHPPNVDAALWLGEAILPALRRLRPQARLQLAGIGAPPEVSALGSREGIEVLGMVPDLGAAIERAAIVMAPVRIGGGMRMKVLQAMAWGKPVITTPLGAEGFAAGPDGPPLVVAPDADGIARAAAALLEDDARRTDLGARARDFVAEQYGPLAYGRRTAESCAEAVALRRGGA